MGSSTLGRRAFRAARWAVVSRVFVTAAGFARNLILARYLGADAFGVVGMALFAVSAIEAVTALGLETALIQRRGAVERDLPAAFTLQVARGAGVALLVWLAAPLVAGFFATAGVEPVLRTLSVLPLLQGLASPAMVLHARALRFDRIAWARVPGVTVGLAAGAWFAVSRGDVWALVIASIAAQATATASSYVAAPWRPRFAVPNESMRHLMRFGRWVQGTRVVGFICACGDNAVVGHLLGPTALGWYLVAFRIAEVPTMDVGTVAARVGLPVLSELRGDPVRLRRWYLSARRTLVAIHAACAALLIVFGRRVVVWLLGPAWEPAVPALRILAAAMVFRSLAVFGTTVFQALGSPETGAVVNGARLLVMAAAIVPLTLAWGIEGTALSVLGASVAGAGTHVWFARRAFSRTRLPEPEE